MKRFLILLFVATVGAGILGCSEDSIVAPPAELAPPTGLTMETREFSIKVTWAASPFEGSGDFVGYNVYMDTASIASVSDTLSSGAQFLAARLINTAPITAKTFTVAEQADGSALVRGQKYYLHVRTVRDDDRLSVASNEVDTATRPEGSNDIGDDTLLMYDFSTETNTRSAYGWDRFAGLGQPFATSMTNQEEIDFFMTEEPNSADDGSEFLSPAQATFTETWTQRNETSFKDLGAGDAAWGTSIAPDIASMSTKVQVVLDHTYALYLDDGHWAKIRVTGYEKNVAVNRNGGGTVNLNQVTFDWAFQLLDDYGRFKPVRSFD